MKINTSFDHSSLNGPRIVAKSMGKQKTTAYDHSISEDANHGAAAGNLILHMFKSGALQGAEVASLRNRALDGSHIQDGSRHIFVL